VTIKIATVEYLPIPNKKKICAGDLTPKKNLAEAVDVKKNSCKLKKSPFPGTITFLMVRPLWAERSQTREISDKPIHVETPRSPQPQPKLQGMAWSFCEA